MKYTPEGSVSVSVGIVDGNVTVAVADTGVGISPEELSRLFQPFSQVCIRAPI